MTQEHIQCAETLVLKLFSMVMAILMYIILTPCSSILMNYAFSPLLLNVEFLGKHPQKLFTFTFQASNLKAVSHRGKTFSLWDCDCSSHIFPLQTLFSISPHTHITKQTKSEVRNIIYERKIKIIPFQYSDKTNQFQLFHSASI